SGTGVVSGHWAARQNRLLRSSAPAQMVKRMVNLARWVFMDEFCKFSRTKFNGISSRRFNVIHNCSATETVAEQLPLHYRKVGRDKSNAEFRPLAARRTRELSLRFQCSSWTGTQR